MDYVNDPIKIGLEWDDNGREVALATVIATWGSSPLPVGSQLVADNKGAFEGSVSGGCIEGAVITEALEVIKNSQAKRLFFGVSNERAWEVGLACGGEIEVYIEKLKPNRDLYKEIVALIRDHKPVSLITDLDNNDKMLYRPEDPVSLGKLPGAIRDAITDVLPGEGGLVLQVENKSYFLHIFQPDPQLIIIGAVHIAAPLVKMAGMTGYDVVIIDPRAAFASKERFPETRLIVEWPDEAMKRLALHSRTAVVALTHDPKLDDPALKMAIRSDAFYIGALGSRKTHASRRERLKIEGFSEEQISRIHGPIGLNIDARTPAEIAVAILAQITAERRKTRLFDIKERL